MNTMLLFLSIFVGTFLSEDLATLSAGAMVAQSLLAFHWAMTAAASGILIGDSLVFALGRFSGRLAAFGWFDRWVPSERKIDQARAFVRRRGVFAVILSRFVPGTRVPVSFASGALGMPFRWFFLAQGAAVLVWVPVLLKISALAGSHASRWLEHYRIAAGYAVIGIPVIAALTYGLVLVARSWRIRRLLLGRLKRLVHWEYWPSWLVYIPVVAVSIVLALRYRSITAFALCNPAIPFSGLKGESKSAILRLLRSRDHAFSAAESLSGDRSWPRLASWVSLDPTTPLQERRELVSRIQSNQPMLFPVVLKPDKGERGEGVAIVKNEEQLVDLLAKQDCPMLAQEYISGPEYGVFWVRPLHKPDGLITAITRKRDTTVTGDGKQTLEQLILSHPRAVAQARFFLGEHGFQLNRIPEPGAIIALNQLGTHCRGSLFVEGMDLWNPELEEAIRRISPDADAFSFGRYDVRAASEAEFAEGRFYVIELNGLTSEPTSMYDPQYGIVKGIGRLVWHWRLAWQSGYHQLRMGSTPASVIDLLRSLR